MPTSSIERADTGAAIGGRITGGTDGSVLFVGASGTIGQDNSNFFWDDTNKNIGIKNQHAVSAGRSAQASDIMVLGTSGGSAAASDRSTIRWAGGGYSATPSATNADANGDKLVFFNDATGKVAIGLGTAYNMWFQCGSSSSSLFTFYSGTTQVLVYNASTQGWSFGTTSATHTITIPSAATGIAFYNTADQTTNYERVIFDYSSNEYWILSEKGGSGANRDIGIGFSTTGGTGGAIKVQADTLPYTQIWVPASNSTSGPHFDIGMGAGGGTGLNGSSGVQKFSAVSSKWNQTSTAGGIDLYINRTETAIGSGQHDFLNMAIAGSTKARIDRTGHIFVDATNTAGGTTGNQTINKPSGTVNFAAAATSITVTNSTCSTSSIVLAVVRTNDTTAVIKNVVPGSGSFVINLNAAATAETSVGFVVIN